MDAKTGEVSFQEKIGMPGPYIASPVVANDHIYAASHSGNVMVMTVQKKPVVVFRTRLKGKILATPAIEGNHLYIRTSEHLYAFTNDLKK
jgi:outer membrane protein assembly factor BamB